MVINRLSGLPNVIVLMSLIFLICYHYRLFFHSCSGLTSVTIGNSVTSIGYRAFYNCSGLTSIVSKATVPPALGNEVFPNPNSYNVIVPCGSLEHYMASSGNNYFPNRIEEDCSSALQEVESTR